MKIVGIDIGGTGVKAGVVDTESGQLVSDRLRVMTPRPATPERIADVVHDLVAQLGAEGPIGVALPAVVINNVCLTAANIDRSWIGTDVAALLAKTSDRPVSVLNDADAAGVAELRFGAGRDRAGVVLLLTLGTGIGSALLVGGQLVPNTELGHLELRGRDAETWTSDGARERDNLSWPEWAKRLTAYLQHVESLLWPDLIVLGGGVSKRSEKFLPLLKTRSPIVPAELRNNAGIIGAALTAVARTSG